MQFLFIRGIKKFGCIYNFFTFIGFYLEIKKLIYSAFFRKKTSLYRKKQSTISQLIIMFAKHRLCKKKLNIYC